MGYGYPLDWANDAQARHTWLERTRGGVIPIPFDGQEQVASCDNFVFDDEPQVLLHNSFQR